MNFTDEKFALTEKVMKQKKEAISFLKNYSTNTNKLIIIYTITLVFLLAVDIVLMYGVFVEQNKDINGLLSNEANIKSKIESLIVLAIVFGLKIYLISLPKLLLNITKVTLLILTFLSLYGYSIQLNISNTIESQEIVYSSFEETESEFDDELEITKEDINPLLNVNNKTWENISKDKYINSASYLFYVFILSAFASSFLTIVLYEALHIQSKCKEAKSYIEKVDFFINMRRYAIKAVEELKKLNEINILDFISSMQHRAVDFYKRGLSQLQSEYKQYIFYLEQKDSILGANRWQLRYFRFITFLNIETVKNDLIKCQESLEKLIHVKATNVSDFRSANNTINKEIQDENNS